MQILFEKLKARSNFDYLPHLAVQNVMFYHANVYKPSYETENNLGQVLVSDSHENCTDVEIDVVFLFLDAKINVVGTLGKSASIGLVLERC